MPDALSYVLMLSFLEPCPAALTLRASASYACVSHLQAPCNNKPRHPKPNVIFPQQGWLHPSRGCLLLQRVWIFVHFAPLTKSLCQWRSRRVIVGELYWLLYSYYVFCTALFCHMLGLRLSYYVTWLTLLYTCIATIHIKDRQVLWYLVGASWGGKTLWVQSPRCLLWRALSWLLSKKIYL